RGVLPCTAHPPPAQARSPPTAFDPPDHTPPASARRAPRRTSATGTAERLGRPYGEVPAVRGSFSVRPPAEPDVPAFPASGSLVTYAVTAAGGRSAWIWSWQCGQITRDLRRLAAMSLAQAGWPGPGRARAATLGAGGNCAGRL